MEISTASTSKGEPSKVTDDSDSNWSDLDSDNDGEKSLRIDLQEDEEAETSMLSNKSFSSKSPGVKKIVPLLATTGSAKKSKM